MKKNFSKALAGALTVAMVLGMAAPAATTAQAANKNSIKTKYKAIYAGKSKTYTLTKANKTTKWVVKGDAAEYVQLSKTKGKSTKVTVASDCPAGEKIKVVAKLKNKKGKYKKVDADSFVIKADATSVNVSGASSLTTGASSTYTATTTPAKTTNIVAFSVTDKDGKATTGATISATSGVLNAIAAGSYKVTAVTARNEANVEAGKITATASMDVTVADKVVPDAKLTEAKQTEAAKFVLTFDSELKEIKTDEITMVNDEDKTSKVIKAVAIGADKKTVTVDTLVDVMDGKSYTFTYKGSTAKVTATDGTVADFTINNDKFQVKKAQELKVKVLDKNQVVIKTIDVKETSVTDGKIEITTTNNDGYFKDGKLIMQTVGKTETVDVVWHSGKNNATTGAEEGNIPKKFTLTAIAQASLKSSYEKATICKDAPSDWDKTTCSLQLPIGNNTDNKLYMKINDIEGVETINGAPYSEDLKITCTSSDETILLVSVEDEKVVLTGVKAGTAYVQVKQDGVTKITVPVTVVAASSLTNIVLNNSSVTISNASAIQEEVKIEASTHKDQYNKDRDNFKVKSIDAKTDFTKNNGGTLLHQGEGNKVVTFQAINSDAKQVVKENAPTTVAGTYEYEIVYVDTDTDKEVKKTVKIKVAEPKYDKTPTIKLIGDDSKDVKISKNDTLDNATVDLKIAAYYDGVLAAYLPIGPVVTNGGIVNDNNSNAGLILKKNGSVQGECATIGAIITKGKLCVKDKTNATQIQFGAKVIAQSDSKVNYLDKVDAASYVVETTIDKEKVKTSLADLVTTGAVSFSGIGAQTLTKTFSIKDTQPTLTISQVKNNVDATTAEDAIKKSCEIVYDGYKMAEVEKFDKVDIECTADGKEKATKDAQFYKNGKVYNIVKLNIFINVGADGYGDNKSDVKYAKVKFEKKPGFSITVND